MQIVDSYGVESKTRIVIVGGGTAGWMTAAALAVLLPDRCSVDLVESEDIGIIGVGEATLPHFRAFLTRLGVDEPEFMRATYATYKLGNRFRDFGAPGESYVHPFGEFGAPLNGIPFHRWWLEARKRGFEDPIGDYSLAVSLAQAGRFRPPVEDAGLASTYSYAYQFDATLFAPFMRDFAQARGVARHEGKVVGCERDQLSGDLAAVVLADGRRLEGDLFIDCSGFRSLLLGQELDAAWEDWTGWLPCDRAAALPSSREGRYISPMTTATGMPAGWRWTIPLQHRDGNGYVFSSAHLSEDEACHVIASAIDGEPLADPRVLRFRPGRRKQSWSRNVVGVGLASGFLEPLESTSIYLSQMSITYLVENFPSGGRVDGAARDRFNRLIDIEYDRVRDFLILHYNASRRADSDFWIQLREMELPESLSEKLALWNASATIEPHDIGLFHEPSWVSVLIGQDIVPQCTDRATGAVPPDALAKALGGLRRAIAEEVATMPSHVDFLSANAARRAVSTTG